MLFIAIIGGISMGKSSVRKIFKELNINTICADKIAKDVVKPNTIGLYEITEKFGENILNDDKTLNRNKLRNIIFNNKELKLWLENLLHPLIRNEIKKQAFQSKSLYCIIEIPIFNKTKFPYINKVIVIDCNQEEQIKRLCKRDNINRNDALKIINQQVSQEERLKDANYIINNNSNNMKDLKKQVEKIHFDILNLLKDK